MSKIVPLILSGGVGSRLWPASRDARPKQFLELFGPLSTFQETLLRVSDGAVFDKPIVITNREHRFLVAEQASAVGCDIDILLEPVRRDSGPAIAAGTHYAALRTGSDPVVVALAADHVIRDMPAFVRCCVDAAEAARDGSIVTFGIVPDHPATVYGYIKMRSSDRDGVIRSVERFVEKPDAATAARYVSEGYLWNSGNFVYLASTLLREYADSDPATEEAAGQAVRAAVRDLSFLVLDEEAFRRAEALSIDYAVMERSPSIAVLPATFDWSDVGGWDAVWALSEKDIGDNVLKGPAIAKDSANNLIMSDRVLTAAVGVEGLAIIATEDAVYVGKREDAASLKALVADLRRKKPNLTEMGARVFRPWGSYQSIDLSDRHQVKRIVVSPGCKLSLQKHFHRSEHWIVVKGTAKVTVETNEQILHENSSIYIPIGAVHRLENPGKINLELIEVQTGSYLGEDDIVRIEDSYNRVPEAPARAGA